MAKGLVAAMVTAISAVRSENNRRARTASNPSAATDASTEGSRAT
jgi:hypothetical protein